jgi:hypothetical protein
MKQVLLVFQRTVFRDVRCIFQSSKASKAQKFNQVGRFRQAGRLTFLDDQEK